MLEWISKNIGGPSTVVIIGVLITVLGTMISATGAFWASRQRARFEKDLAASVIGGDSFCYMFIARNEPGSQGPLYGFTHVGKHPLYDINVRISDMDKPGTSPPTFEAAVGGDISLTLPNMAPGRSLVPGDYWKMPAKDDVRYMIFFTARNGFFTEVLRLRRVDGRWESAIRVRRGAFNDGPVLYEDVSPRYLNDPAEKINWDEK